MDMLSQYHRAKALVKAAVVGLLVLVSSIACQVEGKPIPESEWPHLPSVAMATDYYDRMKAGDIATAYRLHPDMKPSPESTAWIQRRGPLQSYELKSVEKRHFLLFGFAPEYVLQFHSVNGHQDVYETIMTQQSIDGSWSLSGMYMYSIIQVGGDSGES